MRMRALLLQAALPALLVAAAGCSSDTSRMKSDWERANEGRLIRDDGTRDVVLPAYPQSGELVPFTVTAASDFAFFVDPRAVSVAKDGVIRYTVVARSPSGVDNVSYEGLNCKASEYALYAVGLPDHSWRTSSGAWRPIERGRWQATLADQYFCPNGIPVGSAAEGVDALRRGGHPWARSKDAGVIGR